MDYFLSARIMEGTANRDSTVILSNLNKHQLSFIVDICFTKANKFKYSLATLTWLD